MVVFRKKSVPTLTFLDGLESRDGPNVKIDMAIETGPVDLEHATIIGTMIERQARWCLSIQTSPS